MPTGSFPIAPTALSVPLHSYGMLAYQLETSGLRSRSEIAIYSEFEFAMRANYLAVANHFSEDGDLLRAYLKSDLQTDFESGICNMESEAGDLTVEISNSETSVCGLSPVVLSAQGCLTSELLRFL
jgi:hypothetical protein